jgi:hypothetical protein
VLIGVGAMLAPQPMAEAAEQVEDIVAEVPGIRRPRTIGTGTKPDKRHFFAGSSRRSLTDSSQGVSFFASAS